MVIIQLLFNNTREIVRKIAQTILLDFEEEKKASDSDNV
jgi:hypothetical protein